MRGLTEVHVWLDVTSDGHGNTKWIVSVEDGTSSDTKSTHDTSREAMAAGITLAKKLGVKLFASKSPEERCHEIDLTEA